MTETFDRAKLRAELERDEGRRSKPYRDTAGLLTIGVGWNLDANGLPAACIDHLLDRGIDDASAALDVIEHRWRELDADRQRVLLNMAFNLGAQRLARFTRLLDAIGDYLDGQGAEALDRAAAEMQASAWFSQVGERGKRLVARMRHSA